MSADYGTEHYKGYHHEWDGQTWIHVRRRELSEDPVGDFSREEIAELAELAEQAWPGLARDLAAAAEAREAEDEECE